MATTGAIVQLDEVELATLQANPDLLAVWLADDTRTFDLETAIGGVHFLLAGATDLTSPLSFLGNTQALTIAGARYWARSELAAIATAVESMSAKTVRSRLADPALTTIAPFSVALADDDKEWLLAVLQAVMVFLRRAADDSKSILVVVS